MTPRLFSIFVIYLYAAIEDLKFKKGKMYSHLNHQKNLKFFNKVIFVSGLVQVIIKFN